MSKKEDDWDLHLDVDKQKFHVSERLMERFNLAENGINRYLVRNSKGKILLSFQPKEISQHLKGSKKQAIQSSFIANTWIYDMEDIGQINTAKYNEYKFKVGTTSESTKLPMRFYTMKEVSKTKRIIE